MLPVDVHAEALHLRGILALQQSDFHSATRWIGEALALAPTAGAVVAAMHCNRGIAWHRLGDLPQAIDDYDQALLLDPTLALAHANRGVACMDTGRVAQALDSFSHALALAPDHAGTHSNLGNALLQIDQPEQALQHYETALRIDPGNAAHHLHVGLAQLRLDQFAAAQSALLQALRIDPACATAHCYLGETERAQNRLDAALACYESALAIDPEHADAHFFQAVTRLAQGDWQRGWQQYEWRWRSTAARLLPRNFPFPLWLGQSSLQGQRILAHCEQGLGDALQFCRYLPLLAQAGARVVVQAPATLLPVLQTLDGDYEWLTSDAELPPLDWHCPLLSLPLALGARAPLGMHAPGYLRAPPERVRHWRSVLPASGRRRLGIAWSGNALHLQDRHRSLRLEDLLPCLPEDWDIVVLQTELRDTDLPTLQAHPQLQYQGSEVRDFADSAAICTSLDLLLSVDTSVAHLAAALGVPVWLLLPWRADWRWGLQKKDTDWYPGMRLYRQQALQDWDSVLRQVQADLENYPR